jgi:hypothetical protein
MRVLALVLSFIACGCGVGTRSELDGATTDAAVAVDAAAELDAWAEAAPWPMPNTVRSGLPSAQRYEVISDATVRDAVTGLVWARASGEALRTQAEAIADCEALVVEGRDDFRLPSRIEWVSLLDPDRSPAIDGDAFPGTPAEYHWTSSTSARSPDAAFSVYLGGGETTLGMASRASALVRCVSGGASLEGERFVVLDRAVRDRGTGLVWARASISAATWADARDACAVLGRLPSLRELQTIVDETAVDPAIDGAAFPGTLAERHWTSTVRDAGELLPWTVDFADGQTFSDEQASRPHVARCLRSIP